jgi:hypothetical protein
MTEDASQKLFLDDLRAQIKAGRVTVLVGTGISTATSKGSPIASWTGLLMNGVERCEVLIKSLPDGWGKRIREQIQSPDMDDILAAAQQVGIKLQSQPGQYSRWLRETVGQLKPEAPAAIEALSRLKAPICTTNYDTLIEEVIEKLTGRNCPYFTWRHPEDVERVVRGEDEGIGIIPLHGCWREPPSVILTLNSYQQILADKPGQAMLQALRATRTLLFVGFGAGLKDPNFSALMAWAKEAFRDSESRNYRLCLSSEVEEVDDSGNHIWAISYGDKHDDLPSFLTSLAPEDTVRTEQPALAKSSTQGDDLLSGVDAIQIWISQMFRIADLHIYPATVRAKEFLEVITNPSKLRRALNHRKAFRLGKMGSIRTAIAPSDDFWRFLPDLRHSATRQFWFLPFEQSLTEELRGKRYDPTSNLGEVLGESDSIISSTQITGRLRIYPPGVGVIRMGITLTFRESVHVPTVVQKTRDIEQLAFVDPYKKSRPFEDILLELIEEVEAALFDKQQRVPYEERRWRPPEIIYCLREEKEFKPVQNVEALAKLMAAAPRNEQSDSELQQRIREALKSVHWQRDRTFAAVAQGVSLLFIEAGDGFRKNRRDRLQYLLSETSELVSAGAYSVKALVDEVTKLATLRQLDDNWLPGSENFEFLALVLRATRLVLQAIGSAKLDLQRRGAGVLMAFAGDIWAHDNPLAPDELPQSFDYVKNWLENANKEHQNESFQELLKCIEEIYKLSNPFRIRPVTR